MNNREDNSLKLALVASIVALIISITVLISDHLKFEEIRTSIHNIESVIESKKETEEFTGKFFIYDLSDPNKETKEVELAIDLESGEVRFIKEGE